MWFSKIINAERLKKIKGNRETLASRPAGLKHRSHSTGHSLQVIVLPFGKQPQPSIWLTLGLRLVFRPRVSQIEGFGLLSKT